LTLGAVALVLGLAPIANAFQDYVSENNYAVYEYLDPGEFAYSQGGAFNYRTENNGCRSGNSGYMYLQYYNTSYVVTHEAPGWTNCSTGAVLRIYDNGYFGANCSNQGTVGWHAYCNTWNYSP